MKIENALDKIATFSPLAAPAIPAYFAAYNAWYYLVKGHNLWDVLAVVVVALVVETVGLVSVHSAIQLWTWNRTKLKTDGAAPTWIAVASVVMYVVIVVLVNGLLDLAAVAWVTALPYVKIAATALLSLLSINSALNVSLRAGHNERIDRAKKAHDDRVKDRKDHKKVSEKLSPEPVNFSKDWRRLSSDEKLSVKNMTEAEIAVAYQLSKKSARNWKIRAEAL